MSSKFVEPKIQQLEGSNLVVHVKFIQSMKYNDKQPGTCGKVKSLPFNALSLKPFVEKIK